MGYWSIQRRGGTTDSLLLSLWMYAVIWSCSSPAVVHSQYADYNGNGNGEKGLFPNVFNLATNADITANATCGEAGPEIFCKLVEHVLVRAPQCGVCDANALDPSLSHPISHAIDGANTWWQSPTLQNGRRFEWVTVTLDLKQVFQVAYVIIKAANSPRPGNWILERSVDGVTFLPWQYYAISDAECLTKYGIEPREGKPTYRNDSEVICTSYFSRIEPLEDGEIHTSLVNGRPGASLPTEELRDFTRARYVRIRLQKIRTLNADLMSLSSGATHPGSSAASGSTGDGQELDRSIFRRLFYSIKDISIGGQCLCFGHASNCPTEQLTGRPKCQCEHNTCGDSCEQCCPLYNQRAWRAGTNADGGVCESCQCHGHASACGYDPQVDRTRRSLNMEGRYEGGGVCLNCTDFTTGINCEQCLDGYFRPTGVSPDATRPCVQCDCNGEGSEGFCVKTESRIHEGLAPGSCICREGFAGPRCDRCARGFRSFPLCEVCPCHLAGTVDSECVEDCQCKVNVEGSRCDRCKAGYFDLREENPEGCTKCFCFDRTGRCLVANLGLDKTNGTEGWLITDLQGTRVVAPSLEEGRLTVDNNDMADYESYYWLASQQFLGKKLTSYGQTFKFRVSWVPVRGDTGGKPTRGPDVVLEGNGMKIGLGDRIYRDKDTTIKVTLSEKGWYHIPDSVKDITRRRRAEYKGGAVTRAEMLRVLANIQRFMVRAKYHTDQVEGTLHDVELDLGSENAFTIARVHGIEECVCPPGYRGLSCEECGFGYVREAHAASDAECQRCDCNGHADSCDLSTGQCGVCMHNTVGLKCESCNTGYYGDATKGTLDTCKPCRCPLSDASNNFSPTCQLAGSNEEFVCDQCRKGYEGKQCERCTVGYFGNPLVPGNYCQPCDCNNNQDTSATDWCDQLTGQCLRCRGNTRGYHCEQCMEGHYGNALEGNCQPCNCNQFGANGNTCDPVTGQCRCRNKYTGRACDRCKNGFGNVAAGCRQCNCDAVGSITTEVCSASTGQCECRPGVVGLTCFQCLEDHYGFSTEGCKGCGCNEFGSRGRTCDIVTGQCQCKPNVVGRACDACQVGFWNLASRQGCQSCQCDPIGSLNGSCDALTGLCRCKVGVEGHRCETCVEGYFGLSDAGCQPCEKCEKPGHVCDPDTGRCVCPPSTEGLTCGKCAFGSWGYDAKKGCKACNCHAKGSVSVQCEGKKGRCTCKEGFDGPLCDECAFGYYGFPACKKCTCDSAGTDPQVCNSQGVCQCGPTGQCPCKTNVEGNACQQCKEGTFGLGLENPHGCTPCYCFMRTAACVQANFIWTQLRNEPGTRALRIEYDEPHLQTRTRTNANQFPVNTQEICYINLALPGQRELRFGAGQTQLNVTNNLRIIPGVSGDVKIGVSHLFDTPLYWRLPDIFLKDKILSYNGFLRFTTHSQDGKTLFPNNILATYPLVQIQGNQRIILEYFPPQPSSTGHYEVRLHEIFWKIKNNPQARVTREMMMVALQNIQHVLIRATDSMDSKSANLTNVSLDVAVPAPAVTPNVAKGIEMCRCPPGYNSSSCQDPSIGFFRWHKNDYISSTVIIDLVGESKPCQCNGRSQVCDLETGHCLACKENTSGPRCEQCGSGYYGSPEQGSCQPCACPSVERNFADNCAVSRSGAPKCFCQRGYRGDRCERCDYGYYGNPLAAKGFCRPCQCDPHGSVSDECDELTGQCNCKPGITGRDCTFCAPRHVITDHGCTSCEDGCTGVLLRDVDAMTDSLRRLNVSNLVPVPWNALFAHANDTIALETRRNDSRNAKVLAQDLISRPSLTPLAQLTIQRATELENEARKAAQESVAIRLDSQSYEADLVQAQQFAQDVVAYLRNYAIGETPSININRALNEAEDLLNLILRINLQPKELAAKYELEKAQALLARLQGMTFDNTLIEVVRDDLEALKFRLDDLMTHIEKSRASTNDARQILNNGNSSLALGRVIITEISTKSDKAKMLTKNAVETNANTILVILFDATTQYKELRGTLKRLINVSRECEKKESSLSRLIPEYKTKHVIPSQVHANQLTRQASALFDQFNATRDVADLPLQAANAYQKIVDELQGARDAAQSAKQASSLAYLDVYPEDGELSLIEKARLALQKSRSYQNDADRLQHSVRNHSERLKGESAALRYVEVQLTDVRNENDAINRQLDQLTKVREKGKAAVERSADAHSKTSATVKRVVELRYMIDKDLQVRLQNLQAGKSTDHKRIGKLIEEARLNMKQADSRSSVLKRRTTELRTLNTTVSLKLDELRGKILKARQAASSIRVSLSGRTPGCVRTYKPEVTPGTMNNIVLTYAASKEKDAMLFYLPSSKPSSLSNVEFMAIEMIDRRIRFLWDLGGGMEVITHPQQLSNSGDLLDDTQWFRIEAERIGNIGTLSVKPIKPLDNYKPSDGAPVNGVSPARYSKLDYNVGDTLWVGGLPSNASVAMKSKRLSGCLHEVWLDGKPIGLWDFQTSARCLACIEGAQEVKDESSYHFTGSGYAELQQIPRYDSRQYSVTLSFKTFDENALLFLAVNETNGQYISLELSEGKLHYEVRYGPRLGEELALKSRKKYNIGQWIKVEASRVFWKSVETALLKVGDEELTGAPSHSNVPTLNLEVARLYVGGIPPDFRMPMPLLQSIPGAYRGCMKDLQVVAFGLNPLQKSYYGVEASCPDKPERKVGFDGRGYIELKSQTWKKDGSFGLSFQTISPHGVILFSTPFGTDPKDEPDDSNELVPVERGEEESNFINSALRGDKDSESYALAIVGGKLVARFKSGTSGEVISLSSSETYNDGEFHTVVILRSGRKVDVLVDDEPIGTVRLARINSGHISSETGSLYLGGLKADVPHFELLATTIGFHGCIVDAVFNNEFLRLDEPLRFNRAAIGRCQETRSPRTIEDKMLANEDAPAACREVPQYTIEGRAVKFGDSPHSHIVVPHNRKDFNSQFNLTFSFRTHYPNGIFFYTYLNKTKHMNFMLVSLRDGRLTATLGGRRKEEVISIGGLNDGNWHKVAVNKDKRKLSITVDELAPVRGKAPNRLNLDNQLFVGGLPENGIAMAENMPNEPLKGCLKDLAINGRKYDLAGGKNMVHRVGQCFAHVERGSYFAGDAYAVYSNNFKVGAMADIELEFRSTELSGILLSVSNEGGSPALSLYLDEGDVVLSVDMGDNQTFSARQTFPSHYYICDNRWHLIKASYVENALTLKVDGRSEQYGFSGNGNVFEGKRDRPLYIGGIPDGALQGALGIRDNFKGCIRNVVIRGEIRDWTDMVKLNNVLLNSCPLE